MEQHPTSIWKLFLTGSVCVYIYEVPWYGVLVRWLMINSGTYQINHLRILSTTNLLFWFSYFETYDVLLLTMVPLLFHQIPESESPILHLASWSTELKKQNPRLFIDGHWVLWTTEYKTIADTITQVVKKYIVLFSFFHTSNTPITFVS